MPRPDFGSTAQGGRPLGRSRGPVRRTGHVDDLPAVTLPLRLGRFDLEPGRNRRGNCHDTAVAARCFQRLKRERIRRRACPPRDDARRDVIDSIERFYNPKRKHTNIAMLSPVQIQYRDRIFAHRRVNSICSFNHPLRSRIPTDPAISAVVTSQ